MYVGVMSKDVKAGAAARAIVFSALGRITWPQGEARCAIGRTGATPASAKREGDGATPLGRWPMRRLYWRADRLDAPATRLPRTAIEADMGWCDDPASPDYNRLVRLPYPFRCETMWRGDGLYDVVVELGYNDDPVIPGRGSAIFLHVAQDDFSPTEGCVAAGLETLLAIVADAGPDDLLEIL
jgi:L,D-peptidoglycan transpeptidase YkuD (ErfK/YbiS/YcfS/YnhG family)